MKKQLFLLALCSYFELFSALTTMPICWDFKKVKFETCPEGAVFNCSLGKEVNAMAFLMHEDVKLDLTKEYCIENYYHHGFEDMLRPYWMSLVTSVTRTFTLPITLLVLLLYVYTPGLRTHQDKLLKQHLYTYIIAQTLYLYVTYAVMLRDHDNYVMGIAEFFAGVSSSVSAVWVELMIIDLWRLQRYKPDKTMEKPIFKAYKWYAALYALCNFRPASHCNEGVAKQEYLLYYKTGPHTYFVLFFLAWTISLLRKQGPLSQIRWQPLLGFATVIASIQALFTTLEMFGGNFGVVDDIVDIIHTCVIFYFYIYSRNKVLKNLAINRVFQVSWPDTWKTLPDQEDYEETDVELHQGTDQQNLVE